MAPEFVVVGHVVRDLVPKGWRPGGTATYAAVQAQRLGVQAGIVSRVSGDIDMAGVLPGVAVAGGPSARTTTFQNEYRGGTRSQRVLDVAEGISEHDLPSEWRTAPLVLLGPVCGEVPATLGQAFEAELLGVSAQGWLRTIGRDQRVRKRAWRGRPFWRGADVLFVSDEDIAEESRQLRRWCDEVPVVAFTHSRRGAGIHAGGRWREVGAFPANEVDPTGAGDIFASAFMIEFRRTKKDIGRATRFASAAAACAVEAWGVEAIAGRENIERRMAAHPEIDLR